jgi:hypothetical protein
MTTTTTTPPVRISASVHWLSDADRSSCGTWTWRVTTHRGDGTCHTDTGGGYTSAAAAYAAARVHNPACTIIITQYPGLT